MHQKRPESALLKTERKDIHLDPLKSLTFSILGTNLTFGFECFWKSEPSSTSHDSHEAKRSYVLWDQVVLRWCMWKHRPDLHTNRLALQHFCLVLLPDLPKHVLDLHKARASTKDPDLQIFDPWISLSCFRLLWKSQNIRNDLPSLGSPPCPWNTGTCRRCPERRWDARTLGRWDCTQCSRP